MVSFVSPLRVVVVSMFSFLSPSWRIMSRPGAASVPPSKYGHTPLESPSLTGTPGPPTPLESGSRDPIGASPFSKTAHSIGVGHIHRSPNGLGVAVLPAGRFALLPEPSAASGLR